MPTVVLNLGASAFAAPEPWRSIAPGDSIVVDGPVPNAVALLGGAAATASLFFQDAGHQAVSDGTTATAPDFGVDTIAHYRADSVVLASGKIGTWNDLSGNGNHLVQGTAGAQARYLYDPAIRNNPCGEFDGAATFYQLTSLLVGGQVPALYSEFTLIVIAQLYINGDHALFNAADVTGNDNTGPQILSIAAGNIVLMDGAGQSSVASLAYPFRNASENTFAHWHYYLGQHVTNRRSLSIDGGTAGVATGAEAPAAIRRITVGRLSAAALYFLGGRIAEMWLAKRQMTAAEQTALATYARVQYGI